MQAYLPAPLGGLRLPRGALTKGRVERQGRRRRPAPAQDLQHPVGGPSHRRETVVGFRGRNKGFQARHQPWTDGRNTPGAVPLRGRFFEKMTWLSSFGIL